MPATHIVVDSPLGELTLTAEDGSLTGLYFPHHWYPPTAAALGRPARKGSASKAPARSGASSRSTSPASASSSTCRSGCAGRSSSSGCGH